MLPWCTNDLLARAVANLVDAAKIAEHTEMVTRATDSSKQLIWKVESQSGAKPYLVRMAKLALFDDVSIPPQKVRDLIQCGCPGHTLSLKDSEDDRICKHCGAVMLLCVKANRMRALRVSSAPGTQLSEPRPSGPAASAAIKDSLAQSLTRKPKHKSDRTARIAICDAAPKASSPAAIALTQSGATGEQKEQTAEGRYKGYDQTAEHAAHFPVGGCGSVLSLLNAKQSHKMTVHLVTSTVTAVCVTCYTFDLEELTDALAVTAEKGAQVTVIADRKHALGGVTKAMAERLSKLKAKGAIVYLADGPDNGIQHSKVVLSDGYALIGSTNWTNS